MKRILALLLVLSAVLALAACSKTPAVTEDEGTTLVYGSGDYTRINPAMDEHGEVLGERKSIKRILMKYQK